MPPRADAGPGWAAWLFAGLGAAWLVYFSWFISRTVGWSVVPQLLPHEVGGVAAGMAAPAAVLFAIAAFVAHRQRLNWRLRELDE